jgi:uncharacterized repeat protein (TIGR01451 family)
MKSWGIRILLLTAVGGGGWLTVAMAQKQWGLYDSPPPDFSKAPVNAEALGLPPPAGTVPVNGSGVVQASATSEAVPERRAPVDPFQGAEKAEVRGGSVPAATEPARLDADPASVPMARSATPAAHNALRDDIPPANEAGIAEVHPAVTSNDTTPSAHADPFSAQRDGSGRTTTSNDPPSDAPSDPSSTAKLGDRYRNNLPRDPAGRAGSNEGVLPAAGIAAATGGLEAVSNANTPPSANDSALGNRYQSLPNNAPSAGLSKASAEENLLRPAANSAPSDNSAALMARNAPSGITSAPDTAAATPVNIEGMGRPGDKRLEGAQSPSVTLEKIAPPEIQVGKAAKFDIVVRNVGPVEAADVEVVDAVPQGTQLLSTTPKATVGARGEIVWKLGNLKSGEESKLQMEVMPLTEGEIGSVAVVQFRSTASMRTIATKPELLLELNGAKQVMIGGDVTINMKLSNPGTGAASKVVLTEKVPPGFQHPAGSELEFEVGTLKPGESRPLDLTLHAVQAGKFANKVVVEGDANLHTEQTANIEVIAPALNVALNGPGLRYLERQAKYTVSVTNPGTAPAKEVDLVTQLPKGMQFVEASDSGHYDPSSHSVVWSLAELPAGQSGNVTLTTLAKEPGEQKFRTEGRATGGLNDVNEQVTVVEGVAAVLFTVADVDDPVEVGSPATYEIHVVNQGSKAANRVQVGALLPPEMKPTGAEGPAKFAIDGQRVVFEPLARLAPKADVTYRVVGQCLAPGDLRVKVQLQTDEMAQPVTKEESTRVYKD